MVKVPGTGGTMISLGHPIRGADRIGVAGIQGAIYGFHSDYDNIKEYGVCVILGNLPMM
jgi:hypothetical protein